MPSKQVTAPADLLRRVMNTSFVATIYKKTAVTGVEFKLGPGGWIVQAKANIRASSPDQVTVQVRLMANVDGGAQALNDPAKASADNLGYETVVATLAFQAAAGATVNLDLTQEGPGNPEVSDITVTGIHLDYIALF